MPTILHRRGTTSQWEIANPVLASSEIGYETDTRKFKFGDGFSTWDELPYAVPDGSGEPGDPTSLLAHINHTTPHPAYDEDLPSLTGIFENGLL